jgi:hypothetical protein
MYTRRFAATRHESLKKLAFLPDEVFGQGPCHARNTMTFHDICGHLESRRIPKLGADGQPGRGNPKPRNKHAIFAILDQGIALESCAELANGSHAGRHFMGIVPSLSSGSVLRLQRVVESPVIDCFGGLWRKDGSGKPSHGIAEP